MGHVGLSHAPPVAERVSCWITQARNGCGQAFGELAALCEPYLMAVAEKELPRQLRAKICPGDLVQETFLKAMRDFSAFLGESLEQLVGWMRRILLNNLANAVRRFQKTAMRAVAREIPAFDSARASQLNLHDPQPCPAIMMLYAEQRELVEAALGALTPTQRHVILLRCHDGHTFAEIGDILGRTSEAARKLWGRAIQQLRKELSAQW